MKSRAYIKQSDDNAVVVSAPRASRVVGRASNAGIVKRVTTALSGADPGQRAAAGNIFKFLALLLALTLIARGTSGVTLARVGLSSPQRAAIVEAITGSAVVSSKNTVEISVPEGLTITEMYSGAGQSMKPGDAIAKFDADEVAQKLARAIAELDKMLIDLDKLNRAEDTDASSRESAQRSLNRAREDYNMTRAQGDEDISAAREELDKALAAIGDDAEAYSLETAVRSHQRASEDYDSVKTQGEADVAAALLAFEEAKERKADGVDDSALESARRNLQRARADYNSTKSQGEADVKAANDAIVAATKSTSSTADYNSVETASRNLQRARADYDEIKAQYDAEIKVVQDAIDAFVKVFSDEFADTYTDPAPDSDADPDEVYNAALNAALENDPDYIDLKQDLADAKKRAEDNLLAPRRKVEDAESAYKSAVDAYSRSAQQSYESRNSEIEKAQSAYISAQLRAQENLLNAARKVEDAESAFLKAEQDYAKSVQQSAESLQADLEKAETAYDNACDKAQENLLSATRKVEDAEYTLSKAESDFTKSETQSAEKILSDITKAQSALRAAISKADDNLISAARKVEDAEYTLSKASQDYSKNVMQALDTAVQNSASATILQFDIDKQSETVSQLEQIAGNGNILYCGVDGVVASTLPEGSVTGAAPLVTFRDGAKGYEATMRLNKNEASKLAVGDECEVTTGGGSMYYSPTVTGVLSGIAQPDDNDMSSVTIRLPDGDWNEGQKVDAQVVINSGNYDFCVPISALRSDNTGYYLFVTEPRNTVLGMQNTVVRVNVSIIASDDEMASVTGALGRDSSVIVSSNKTITHGDRVRVENE